MRLGEPKEVPVRQLAVMRRCRAQIFFARISHVLTFLELGRVRSPSAQSFDSHGVISTLLQTKELGAQIEPAAEMQTSCFGSGEHDPRKARMASQGGICQYMVNSAIRRTRKSEVRYDPGQPD